MVTLSVGVLKTQFADILKRVQNGEEIAIAYGKKKEIVAIIVPADRYFMGKTRKIGFLEGKASFKLMPDFKISTEEFLDS